MDEDDAVTILVYLLASILAWYGMILIYNISMLSVGLFFGARVEAMSVGFGPVMFSFYDRGIEYRFSWIPTGGYVKFEDDADLDPQILDERTYDPESRSRALLSLDPLSRLLIVSSGPVSSLATGLLMAHFAMQFPGSDLRLIPGETSNLPASGVPHLVMTNQRATWETYAHLSTDGVLPYWGKLLTFQALPGWGGLVGMLATCTAAGGKSPAAWVTCMAMIFVANGLINCLPIPPLNGWKMARYAAESVLGRGLPDEPTWFVICGILGLYLIQGRLLLNDLFWGLGLLTGD
jgi:membrane-associated protease RseP (regulator of RpoE activity)